MGGHDHQRRPGAGEDTSVDRKDRGLTWNVGLESGGWLVGDKIKIHIEFELVAPAHELVAATA